MFDGEDDGRVSDWRWEMQRRSSRFGDQDRSVCVCRRLMTLGLSGVGAVVMLPRSGFDGAGRVHSDICSLCRFRRAKNPRLRMSSLRFCMILFVL